MNVLAIDTSNQALGVALLKDEQLIGKAVTNIKKNHSVRLMPTVDYLMREVNMTAAELDKIVVAKGPGSYTGVRIGLTTAKTMAWALDIPVVGVSSLEALAWQGTFYQSYICPFFDARRGLVYTGLYQWNGYELKAVKAEQNSSMELWLRELAEMDEVILFLSPDIHIHQDEILRQLGDKACIPSKSLHIADPLYLALAGLHKKPETTHTLTPNYLRLAEAEANWIKKQKEKKQNG